MTNLTDLHAALKTDPTVAPYLADALEDAGQSVKAALVRALDVAPAYEPAKVEAAYGLPTNTLRGLAHPHTNYHQMSAAERADAWMRWAEANRPAIEAKAAELRKAAAKAEKAARIEAAAIAAAETGDVAAALASRRIRELVRCGPDRTGRPSDFLGRKALKEAKARLSARADRKAAKKVADAARGTAGANRWADRWLSKLRAKAVAIGQTYHRETAALYRSKFGEVLYGRGGQETVDRERYSKGYHSSFGPARNLNGGARLDSETRPTCVILENFRGTEVARISLR